MTIEGALIALSTLLAVATFVVLVLPFLSSVSGVWHNFRLERTLSSVVRKRAEGEALTSADVNRIVDNLTVARYAAAGATGGLRRQIVQDILSEFAGSRAGRDEAESQASTNDAARPEAVHSGEAAVAGARFAPAPRSTGTGERYTAPAPAMSKTAAVVARPWRVQQPESPAVAAAPVKDDEREGDVWDLLLADRFSGDSAPDQPISVKKRTTVTSEATPVALEKTAMRRPQEAPSSVDEAAALIEGGVIVRDAGTVVHAVESFLRAMRAGFIDEARDVLENALGGDVSWESLIILARVASDENQKDLAARLYLRASQLAPHVPDIRRNLVVCLSMMDQDAVAIPFARQLVADDPDNLDYIEICAQVLSNSGHDQEARDLCSEALKRFPSSTWLFQFWLDSSYRLSTPAEEIHEAARSFLDQTSIEDRGRAYAIFANALGRMDLDEDSIKYYELALSLGETSPLVRGNYAAELSAVGRRSEAVAVWERALQDADDEREFSAIQRQYVNHLVSRKRKGEAVRIAQLRFSGSSDPDVAVDHTADSVQVEPSR